MKGTNATAVHDWYQFVNPDNQEVMFRVDIPFMMSNWNCLYGRGCPGWFGTHEDTTDPDGGCCHHGAYINSQSELERIATYAAGLTVEDISGRGLAHIRRKGWFHYERTPGYDKDNPDAIVAKTKVRDGICVFQNRSNEGDGKIGCALVHYGLRTGKPNHIDVMPTVCWQVPIAVAYEQDVVTGMSCTVIYAWDSDRWSTPDNDGTHNSWMAFNCVDAPDAYTASKRLYQTMELELRKTMGDRAYEILAGYCDSRASDYNIPAAGSVVNGGRPMLPLIVGNRTPKRVRRS